MTALVHSEHTQRLGRGWFTFVLTAALALTLLFLGLPILALFVNVSPAQLISSLADGASVDALRLSLGTSAVSLALIVLVGTPAAWMLATREFRLKPALVTLVELPLVLPPAAAGIALLAALGPHGIAGGLLDDAGITLVLTTAGVVVAMTFVASPFYIRQAQAAFESLDPRMLEAARTLGASERRRFTAVAIPLARNGLFAGAALAWGRALGEFGATLMFAGSLRGVTQTAPLALYELFATDFPAALALAAVLLAVSAAVLLAVRIITRSDPNAASRA
jgi:molybdate transport system permease protein